MDSKKLDLISKKEFDDSYNKHQPSLWVKLAYKYFSKNTEKENLMPKNTITGILGSMFFIGFFSVILNLPKKLIGIITIFYSIMLALLVFYLFSAAILNNLRIKKIREILGVTKNEYNILVDKFYFS